MSEARHPLHALIGGPRGAIEGMAPRLFASIVVVGGSQSDSRSGAGAVDRGRESVGTRRRATGVLPAGTGHDLALLGSDPEITAG